MSSTSLQLDCYQKEWEVGCAGPGLNAARQLSICALRDCVAMLENCFHFSGWEGNVCGKHLLLEAVTF